MRTPDESLRFICDCGVMAVIRVESSAELTQVARALKDGDVGVIEVTMTTPNAFQVISDVGKDLGAEVLVGVGSVLDAETARGAILAGAEFVVGPSFHPEVVAICKKYGKVVVPGAFTPTEIVNAMQSGADLVKVFPATALGPQYIRDLRAPLPQVRLVPTGGVNLDNAGEFIKAGAAALGVGSALVERQAVKERNFARITDLASRFRAAVKAARR